MERFIVGTGRCGSTLLSRRIAECPAASSLCEVLNGLAVLYPGPPREEAERLAEACRPGEAALRGAP